MEIHSPCFGHGKNVFRTFYFKATLTWKLAASPFPNGLRWTRQAPRILAKACGPECMTGFATTHLVTLYDLVFTVPLVYKPLQYEKCGHPKQAGRNSGRILRLFNGNDRVFFAIAGCAKAKMSILI